MRKVKIKGLPNKASGGDTGRNSSGANEGLRRYFDGVKNYDSGMNQFAAPEFEVNKSISAVDRSEANIEAEGGEYAVVPGKAGIPESYKINGPRHGSGGVPLNLSDDSFIFSDTKDMKIKDKEILAEFGVSIPKKGKPKAYTPADLAKKYDLNKYKKTLLNPNSDRLERETAEAMIKNYNMKLGKLALVQESKKGFPQEVPEIAMPYLQSIGQDPSQFSGAQPQPPIAAYGAGVVGDPSQYSYGKYGGQNKQMAKRFNGLNIAQRGGEFEGAFWKSIMQGGGSVDDDTIVQETLYGTPSDVTINSGVVVRDQQQVPAEFQGDFFHYNAGAEEGVNPYTKTFGDRFRNTTKMFQNPRRNRQTTVFQDGGEKGTGIPWKEIPTENTGIPFPEIESKNTGIQWPDYQTEADYITNQIIPEQNLMTGPEPITLTPDQIVLISGSKKQKEEVLRRLKTDAEAAGLDENAYITETLKDMTYEQIKQAEKDMTGFPIKSLRKELEREAQAAGRAMNPGRPYDPDTGEFIDQTIGTNPNIEVEKKTIKKYNIPKTAKVWDEGDNYEESKTKAGDYIKRKDGTYQMIKKGKWEFDRKSTSGADNYIPTYGSIEEDVKKANEIVDANPDFFTRDGDKIKIKRSAKQLSLADKDFLTRVSSYGSDKGRLGAPGFNVGTQSSSGDPFYGFVGPDLVEYRYWKAKNPSGSVEDYESLTPQDREAAREEYFTDLGYDTNKIAELKKSGVFSDPEKLYTKEFMSGDEGFTARNQKFFDPEGFRPGHGDDFKFGLEHVDEYNFKQPTEYEDIKPEVVEAKKEIPMPDAPAYINQGTEAPWWAQDVGNMFMTVAERASLKKYMPNSIPIHLQKPDVVYFDPSRALAANAEQANIAAQTVGAFAGSQGTAQLSGIQGQAFAQAANTLADYEAKNVGVANQYLDKVNDVANREHLANAQRLKTLYDETTIANQQYDNSKRAANRNVFEAWRQGLTNATKTQSLNLLYPQYHVDPSMGGPTSFTNGRPQTERTPPGSASNNYAASWKQFQKENPDLMNDSTAVAYNVFKDSYGLNPRQNEMQRLEAEKRAFLKQRFTGQ